MVWSVEILKQHLELKTDTVHTSQRTILERLADGHWREAVRHVFTFIYSLAWKMYDQQTQKQLFQYIQDVHGFFIDMEKMSQRKNNFNNSV